MRRRDRRLRGDRRVRLISRLAELRKTGGRAVLFTVVEGDGVGGKALVVEGGRDARRRRAGGGARTVRRARPRRAQPARRGRRREGLHGVVRAAAATARLRRGGHRGGALSRREAARLDGDRRRCPRDLPDARADAHRRRPDPEVAAGGDRRGRAGSPDRDRRPDARRQVRRAGADRRRSRPRRSTSARSAPGATRSAVASGCSRRACAEEQLTRIVGPCGLDIGADTQEETALSILSEILAVRATARAGRSARRSSGSTSRCRESRAVRLGVGHQTSDFGRSVRCPRVGAEPTPARSCAPPPRAGRAGAARRGARARTRGASAGASSRRAP